jgi:hypothetical protein
MLTSLQAIAEKSKRLNTGASISEEPGAEKPHAGICAGVAEQSATLPRPNSGGWVRSGVSAGNGALHWGKEIS